MTSMTQAPQQAPQGLRREYRNAFRDKLTNDALMWRINGTTADDQRRTYWTGPWCSLPAGRCYIRAAAWREVARDWAVQLADHDPTDEWSVAYWRSGYSAAKARAEHWSAKAVTS